MKVVLAYFPMFNSNKERAAFPHICVELAQFEFKGRVFSILVYGTSKMIQMHEGHGVISIRKEDFIEAPFENLSDVGHFVGGKVAVLPSTSYWIVPDRKGLINTSHVTASEMRNFLHESSAATRKLLDRLVVTGEYGVL